MKPPVFNPDWSAEVKALHLHDMQEIWDRRLAPHVWNQYHNQLETYLAFAGPLPLEVLDVGCAQGTLALLLAERGHSVTAVDLRPEFLAYAKSRHTRGNIRFMAANVLEDEIPGTFDLIFANQIIEHLVYPELMLRNLAAKLKPGGRLVVTTPNGQYIRNALPSYRELGNPKDWEHLQFTADGDGHFFAYRADELVDLFGLAGFIDVGARCFESPMISGHMKLRHIHQVLPGRVLRFFDRLILVLPWFGPRMAHQLLVTGRLEQAG